MCLILEDTSQWTVQTSETKLYGPNNINKRLSRGIESNQPLKLVAPLEQVPPKSMHILENR